MPAAYARPCGKRGRTDAADAEAVCEAVSRPTTRFAPVKSAKRQAGRLDHKAREFLVRRRTRIVDGMRARLAESGIVIAKGAHNLDRLLATVEAAPEATRPALASLADRLRDTHDRIAAVTARIEAAQGEDPFARRLASAPGIGTIPASALAATTPNVGVFRTGRDHAARLGLTPKMPSSGGKERRVLESGRSRSSSAAPSRSDLAHQIAARQGARLGLAQPDAGTNAREAGRGRLGEPHGPRPLSPDRIGRELPG